MLCLFLLGTIVGLSTSSTLQMTDRNFEERDLPMMSVPELIRYWGYPVEEHWVATEDGYILGLHRIPHGQKDDDTSVKRPVAYLQHALTSSSAQWIFGPPGKSLGFILADKGYDVWMGNSRGNSYSRNHTSLDPCSSSKCKDFWDFGWDEGGKYDVPTGIDYALKVTGQDSVYYAGHSMGTTQYFVMLSQLPEYNKKIKVGAMLAPPVFMSHATNIIFAISDFGNNVEILYHLFGLYEFLPHSDIIDWLAHLVCGDETSLFGQLCLNVGFLLLGFNQGQLNATMIPTYLEHIPEGTSTRPFVHYAQLYLTKGFGAYDFGREENLKRYNQAYPPQYDLAKVTAPTAIFKADKDDLVSLIDVSLLVNKLPNVVYDHLVEAEGWTHIDYAIAMDADKLVYQQIVEIFAKY